MALIAYLWEHKSNRGPHLLIVPNAVTVNWKSELNLWLPDVHCVYYTGTKEERDAIFKRDILPERFNVLVTTFELAMIHKKQLSKIRWRYLIVDEAQRLKDRNSLLSRTLAELTRDNCLFLTGTPLQARARGERQRARTLFCLSCLPADKRTVALCLRCRASSLCAPLTSLSLPRFRPQNDVAELWALLNLLLPQVFTEKELFESWFKPKKDGGAAEEDDWLETEKKALVIARLHQASGGGARACGASFSLVACLSLLLRLRRSAAVFSCDASAAAACGNQPSRRHAVSCTDLALTRSFPHARYRRRSWSRSCSAAWCRTWSRSSRRRRARHQ